jgi:hypothetical protein
MKDRSTWLMGLALAALIAGAMLAPVASGHHGWRWAENENSEITGTIKSVRLGNPHGEMTIVVNGEEWTAEIGQPWRNEQAGLTPALLAEGTSVTVQGHRALDKSKKLIKAERVVIGGKTYNLYPDRD